MPFSLEDKNSSCIEAFAILRCMRIPAVACRFPTMNVGRRDERSGTPPAG
jgi:hypothetical protein